MSVSNITAKTPNLGDVVAASSGDTVFTVDGIGNISRSSGFGLRMDVGTSQVSVTVKCGNQAACDTTPANISISNIGSPTGRARAMSNFQVFGVTPTGGSTSGNPVNFTVAPIGKNNSLVFTLGMDFAIAGEDSGLGSGTSASNFIVEIGPYPGAPTASRTSTGGTAKVYRPIAMSKSAELVFGTIVRPKTGGSTVSINKNTGARTVSGSGFGLPSPTFGFAGFMITGEGGQHFSVTIDDSLTMTSGSDMLVADLLPSVTGTHALSGALGDEGSLLLTVGAQLGISSTTPSGAYWGIFNVTILYN